MLDRIFVIAGNRREFERFIHAWSKHDAAAHRFIYVSEWHDMVGVREPRVFLYGNYRLREDWTDLMNEMDARNARVAKVPE